MRQAKFSGEICGSARAPACKRVAEKRVSGSGASSGERLRSAANFVPLWERLSLLFASPCSPMKALGVFFLNREHREGCPGAASCVHRTSFSSQTERSHCRFGGIVEAELGHGKRIALLLRSPKRQRQYADCQSRANRIRGSNRLKRCQDRSQPEDSQPINNPRMQDVAFSWQIRTGERNRVSVAQLP